MDTQEGLMETLNKSLLFNFLCFVVFESISMWRGRFKVIYRVQTILFIKIRYVHKNRSPQFI